MAEDISGSTEESVLVSALSRVIEHNMAYSLIASDGVSERIFYFAIGGIRVIRSGPRKSASVGEILVDAGKLSPEDVGRVISASKQDGQLFGESCVALGLLSQEEIDEALRTKVQDEVLDLFLWDGAEIHLQEGQPPKAFYEGRFESARVSCEVAAFLQTVLARVEDWRGVLGRLPTGREVYEATDEGRSEHPDGPKSRLLSYLDGTRTAADAITRSAMRRVGAYEFLLDSLRTGKVRRVAGNAAQKISRDELMKEIEALEDALKVNADAMIVRSRLARALEAAGENSRAAGQWRFLGDRWRRENDLDRAMECYRSGVRAVPTDFATRELVLEIHRHKRDYGALVADGRPLADLFLKHNLLNRAKNLLLQLVGLEANDTSLRRQLVMVLIGLGERELALKHLRDLARILEARNATPAELRDIYVRILALDKNDKHAQNRLDTITGARFQRRIVRGTLGATAAALLLLGSWFVYEGSARRGVNDAIATARKQFEAKDYAGAHATLEASIRSYRHAKAAQTAQFMIQQIEDYERKERERLGNAVDLGRSPAQREEAAAKALASRAKDLAETGRAEDAYRAYRELFDLYGHLPLVENVSLPLRISVIPLDSHVLLAGEEIGQGALVLQYSPHAKCTLVVQREGYAPFKRVLDGPQEPTLAVSLEKPLRWTFATSSSIDAPPLVAGGMVYVAGRDRCLTAISVADGAAQWRTPLGFYSDVAVRPVMTTEGLFVATATGEAVCLNASTGDVLWRKEVGASVDRQPVGVAGGAVLVSGNDGSLRAFDGDGTAAWTLPPGTAAASPVAIEDGQMAYVDGKGGLVFASCSTGEPLPGYSQPAVLRGVPVADDGRLWVMAEDSSLRVIASATRRAVKRFPVPGAADLPPTVVGDVAYAMQADGTVHAFKAGGDAVFHAKVDEPPSAAPAVANGRLYVPGAKGHLHVLDAATGALLWRFDAQSKVTSTPVIEGGTIYVTTAAGKLFAVTE